MSRSKSDTSEVTSNSPPFTSSHLSISSTQTVSATTSSTSPVVSSKSIPTTSGSGSISSQIPTQVMANHPWTNPGVMLFANPHPLQIIQRNGYPNTIQMMVFQLKSTSIILCLP